jgi:hypothetical protein
MSGSHLTPEQVDLAERIYRDFALISTTRAAVPSRFALER